MWVTLKLEAKRVRIFIHTHVSISELLENHNTVHLDWILKSNYQLVYVALRLHRDGSDTASLLFTHLIYWFVLLNQEVGKRLMTTWITRILNLPFYTILHFGSFQLMFEESVKLRSRWALSWSRLHSHTVSRLMLLSICTVCWITTTTCWFGKNGQRSWFGINTDAPSKAASVR